MIKKIIQILFDRKQFFIYALIGASGALLDYLAFLVMMQFLPIHYLFINFISTTMGIANNFFLNARFNFKIRDNMLRRFVSFYAIGMLGLVVASGMLYGLIDLLAFPPALAKLLSIVVIVLLQYQLNKRISFKNSQSS